MLEKQHNGKIHGKVRPQWRDINRRAPRIRRGSVGCLELHQLDWDGNYLWRGTWKKISARRSTPLTDKNCWNFGPNRLASNFTKCTLVVPIRGKDAETRYSWGIINHLTGRLCSLSAMLTRSNTSESTECHESGTTRHIYLVARANETWLRKDSWE